MLAGVGVTPFAKEGGKGIALITEEGKTVSEAMDEGTHDSGSAEFSRLGVTGETDLSFAVEGIADPTEVGDCEFCIGETV